MQRESLIDQVLAAARRPMPETRELFELSGSDGKWYRPEGFPFGVNWTGEKRSVGFAYLSREGTTYGVRGKSREELEQRHNAAQDREAASFRAILEDADDVAFASQVSYWLKLVA